MAPSTLCAAFTRTTCRSIVASPLCVAASSPRRVAASVSSRAASQPPRRGFSSTPPRRSPPLPSPELAILSPLVERLGQLPELLHLTATSHPYTVSIIVLTFVLRGLITLPATVWQRRRTKRLVEDVMPQWEAAKKTVPLDVRRTCRRQGKSYEQFLEELQATLKIKLTQLLRKYDCSPIPTLVVPLAVSIPLFLLLSALVRQGAVPPTFFSSEILPWWSPPEDTAGIWAQQRSILAEKGLDTASLDLLAGKSGPTLADRDGTMISPIALGMLTMLNVELGAFARRINSGSALTELKPQAAADAEGKVAEPVSSTREENETPRTKGITNGLRAMSIIFVPVAMQAPGALVIYWLSSASFTLIQNTIFAILDKRRVTAKITGSQK